MRAVWSMVLAVAAGVVASSPAGAQIAERAPERRVSLELNQVPLRNAVDRLAQETGARFTVAPNVPNVLVNVTLRDVNLDTALRLISRSAASKAPGVGFWPDGDAYVVRVGGLLRRPGAAGAVDVAEFSGRLVTLSLQDMPLRRAVDALFRQVGVNYMVHRDMPDAPITLYVQDLPFEQALELFTQEAQDQVPSFNIKKVGETYLVRTRTDDVAVRVRPTQEVTVQDPTDSRFVIAKIALRNESIFTLSLALGFPTMPTDAQLFRDSFGGIFSGAIGQLGQNSGSRSQYYLYPQDGRRGQ